MTCRDMRSLMLHAELNELAGAGDSPLAAHLRECIPCRAAARRILSGTQRLAYDVRSIAGVRGMARASNRPRRRDVVAMLALAAAAALVLAVGWGPDPVIPVVSLPRVVARAELPLETRVGAPSSSRRDAGTSAARSRAGHPLLGAAPATAVVPAGADHAPATPIALVGVEVPPGKEAVVMRTANPRVTVVWLR